jgi:hypothetical protein
MIDWAGREVRPIVFKELRTKNFQRYDNYRERNQGRFCQIHTP